MKRILAIINPKSGTSSKNRLPSLLAEAFQDTDWQLFITYTKRAEHAFELASYAVEHQYDAVIAIGGDGTVNEVARALIHTNTALAIIPKGSGNGLARALELPMNVAGAIDVIVRGKQITIDCCKANDYPFFCTFGMGFDAEVSASFAEAPFRGLLSYAATAIRKYINYKPSNYVIRMDDKDAEPLTTEAFVVAAANASQYGNNAYIAPKADMQDGLMDLVVLKPFGHMELAQVTLQLFTKKLEENINQSSYQIRKATISREHEGVVHLDGEPIQMPQEIHLEVIPSSIKVFVP